MKNILKYILLGFWLVVSGEAFATGAAVDSAAARKWAEDKGQELLATLSESDLAKKYAKLDVMMTEDVNLDYVSKFVIGKYARLMTKEQMLRYTDLFRRYALSLYKQINFNFDANAIHFSIDSVMEYPLFTTVNCSVDSSSLTKDIPQIETQKIPVKFKLIRGEDNRIQAVDVEISEVSLVIEYRKQFYKMMEEEEGDANWFLNRLQNMVQANEQAAAQKLGTLPQATL